MAEETPTPPPDLPGGIPPDAGISQAEIDAVMAAMNEPAPAPGVAAEESAGGENLDAMAIEDLLKNASFEDASSMQGEVSADLPAGQSFNLPNFQDVLQDAHMSSIELLRDVELNVKIELGRSRMLVEDVLKLGEGSVVELDKLAGDPVDVFVNDRLIARGEVLVLNDNFCVRVNEIIAGAKEERA